MAGFDAEKLGKRLEEINREQLAAIEKLSEELLAEMRRKGPLRAGVSDDTKAEAPQSAESDRVQKGQTR